MITKTMQRLSVLFPTPLGCFDYLSADSLPAGTFVHAPFGHKSALGIVWNTQPDESFPIEKLKKINDIENLKPLPEETIKFVNWVSAYTLAPLGAVLKMTLCSEIGKESKKPIQFKQPNPTFFRLQFSEAQQEAIDSLLETSEDGFNVSLLDGVTGSGKTEVYFEILAKIFQSGGQALVLLPEITLTGAWLSRFEKRFGVQPAVWHSNLTPKQRRDTWNAVHTGSAQIVVGARSALFLPFQNLKLIVVDEEHDSSFKQEDGVLYQARDMAIVRAKIADCPIILASATPSIETYCNTLTGKYNHIILPERFAGATLPTTVLADMRQKEKGPVRFISKQLEIHLKQNLEDGNQSLLFLNRRGYAPLMLCRGCGERLKCKHCSAWLVEHKTKKCLMCHHCGYTKAVPKTCAKCGQSDCFVSCGPGVERILEETNMLFPTARTALITSDTLTNLKEFNTVLTKMENHEIDILIGTQILAKGHHFADLTLVGIIDADMGLSGGDLRAGERTFQLLQQVMGRAGRGQKKGTAIIQTFAPENMIIQALKNNDRQLFLTEEMKSRQLLKLPPFGRLAAFIISGKQQIRVEQAARIIVQKAPFSTQIDVLGPVPAPIPYLRNKHRYRILVKTAKETNLQSLLKQWMKQVNIPTGVDVRLDIDPYSFF
ncbi:MAG: primosomal protein N' [Alphaproteobacteria bacterium]|nr:primosomal protein N' [Alphaproteobacteria bacterium]MBQ8557887.1 primosomal protein N' [Alphaproteobacteria bacterium]